MKNQHKQMGLDELCNKLTNKKSGSGSNGPMSLEQKMDFVSHQAYVRQGCRYCSAFHQKEIKKKDTQSNIGFAANMLHSTLNLNGGLWSSMLVGNVSCG
jgi:hypothetical protein